MTEELKLATIVFSDIQKFWRKNRELLIPLIKGIYARYRLISGPRVLNKATLIYQEIGKNGLGIGNVILKLPNKRTLNMNSPNTPELFQGCCIATVEHFVRPSQNEHFVRPSQNEHFVRPSQNEHFMQTETDSINKEFEHMIKFTMNGIDLSNGGPHTQIDDENGEETVYVCDSCDREANVYYHMEDREYDLCEDCFDRLIPYKENSFICSKQHFLLQTYYAKDNICEHSIEL